MSQGLFALLFVFCFVIAMIAFALLSRRGAGYTLRPIATFGQLRRAISLSVEAGKRLHLSLGRGATPGAEIASAFVGLSLLERVTRVASISDQPPVATSGDATLAILSQDVLRAAARDLGGRIQVDPAAGQLSGLTPLSYAVGTLPVLYDEDVSTSVLIGHFGSEVGFLTDAAERSGSLILGGSDQLPAQAVMVASASDALIGEEVFVAGAYTQAGAMHTASLRAQDVARWLIVSVILVGILLKLLGKL